MRTITPTEVVAGEIRAELARQRISLRHLSELSGLSYDTVRKRVHGEGGFPLDDLVSISRALGVDPGEWLTLDGVA